MRLQEAGPLSLPVILDEKRSGEGEEGKGTFVDWKKRYQSDREMWRKSSAMTEGIVSVGEGGLELAEYLLSQCKAFRFIFNVILFNALR